MRKQVIVGIMLLAALLGIRALRRPFSNFFFPAIETLVEGGERLRRNLESFSWYFLSKQQLVEQLAQLEQQHRETWHRMANAERAAADWKALAAQMHWVDEPDAVVATTRIYTLDLQPQRTFVIAAGTRHGVKKGQRVVTSAGEFFGVIRDVREEMAMVTSINQRDFSVKVTHAGSVRVIGVTAGGTDTELKVQFIPKTVSLALGELLFAYRELGNPSHIPLGIVKSIESGLDALFQNATLALLTPIPRVTIVSVLSN